MGRAGDGQMRILNLYSGVGGNRRLWGDSHEIIAVELNTEIAEVYSDLYPKDVVLNCDAHEYLRLNYDQFDYIWSSPPCPSHSRMRQFSRVRSGRSEPIYPDFGLYEEIVYLEEMTDIPWSVENVRPYYKPLIEPQWMDRHAYWAPFTIPYKAPVNDNLRTAQIPQLQTHFDIDLSKYKISNKRQILRNMVHPETGLHILNAAIDWKS